jgi:AP endonuclease-2
VVGPPLTAILSLLRLGADIVCLQETKVKEDAITAQDALVGMGYESFWAFSTSRKGHSGVATYVREQPRTPARAQAQSKASTPSADAGAGGAVTTCYSPVAAFDKPFGDSELDDEGRCLVTDHGAFVVINVYVPNAGDGGSAGGRPRLEYKLLFLAALQKLGGRLVCVDMSSGCCATSGCAHH